MKVTSNISNLDKVIVINKSQEVFKVWHHVPDTTHARTNVDRPLVCFKAVKQDLSGYELVADTYALTLEELNEGLETSYTTLTEFFNTLQENEYLTI